MASRSKTTKSTNNDYIPQTNEMSAAARSVWGIVLFGIAILMVYCLVARPQKNAVDLARSAMLGLMGSCAVLLPAVAAWFGVAMLSAKTRRINPARATLIALALALFCGLMHLPACNYIYTHITFTNLISFVTQSYEMGAVRLGGSGALGGLVSYLLYTGLGAWAAGLILFFALLATVFLAFRISLPDMVRGIVQWVNSRRSERREPGDIPPRHLPPYTPQRAPKLKHAAPELDAFINNPPPVKSRRNASGAPWEQDPFAAVGPEPEAPFEAIDVPSLLRMDNKPAKKAPEEKPVKVTAKKVKKAVQKEQEEQVIAEISAAALPLEKSDSAYQFPPIDLLSQPKQDISDDENDEVDAARGKRLLEMLESFGIQARISHVSHGPAITRFELQPAPGIKVSRIVGLADNIALTLAATSVRIEAPIPGKAALGVEVPNEKVSIVPLRTILESKTARKHPSKLAFGLGMDNAGECIIADIASMPHVLIAGSTGAGKSACINTIIASILYRATPDEVRMIMIDPKMVELSVYNGIPHLLIPVVTDPKKAAGALQWAVVEMQERYKKFSDRGVRDMKGYNGVLDEGEAPLPQILVIIDELADLMMIAPGEVEEAICRLAQLARAAGIHLVIATQRPSVNFITGAIKANIPSRIAFAVASQIDSRTILDIGGAEKLLGKGDMLYAPLGLSKPMRVQGAYVPDREVQAIAKYVMQRQTAEYDATIIEQLDSITVPETPAADSLEGVDELLPQAIDMALEAGQISISMLQRRMRIGYARAGRLVDGMTQRGFLAPAEGSKPRDVLITREQFNQLFLKQ